MLRHRSTLICDICSNREDIHEIAPMKGFFYTIDAGVPFPKTPLRGEIRIQTHIEGRFYTVGNYLQRRIDVIR